MTVQQKKSPYQYKDQHLEERFQLLLQAVETVRDYGIFMLDPKGTILTWNAGAERIKGYTADEIIGRNFETFYTQEDRDRKYPAYELEVASKVGQYEDEGWRVRKDGTRFWANVLITRLDDLDGKIVGFSKVTRDLTERKMAEEQLRESEERFRLLVDGVRDYALFMLDRDGRVSTWNEGARRLKGYRDDEILGKHFSIFYPPEELSSGKIEYEIQEATLTGRFEDEGWRVRKDGTRFWANVILTAIRDKHGQVVGFSKITRDLTEKKRSEERLKRAYDDLDRRIKERTQELEQAYTQLKQREADLESAINVRDEFLSIGSHELKTPVTTLKLQLQLLQRVSEKGLDPEKVRRAIDTCLRQAERLVVLVDDLLDVSAVRSGQLSFNFQSVDLAQVVRSVSTRMAPQLKAAGCKLSIDTPASLVAEADPIRIEQVVANLLGNAVKYAAGKPVEVTLRGDGNVATIVVADNGPGIEPSSQRKIFERFERAVPASKISGMGLGLYISKLIADAHHGRIGVESVPGKGAAFSFQIPLNLRTL